MQPASGGFDGFGDDDAFGADPAPSAVLGGELLGGDFMTGGEAVADAPSAAVDEAPVVPDDAPLIMGGGDDDFLGGEPAAPAAPAAPAMKIAEKKVCFAERCQGDVAFLGTAHGISSLMSRPCCLVSFQFIEAC